MIEDLLQPIVEISCYFLGRFTARIIFPHIKIAERNFYKHKVKLRNERWSFSPTYILDGKRYFKDDILTLLGFIEITSLLVIVFIYIY